MLKKLKTPWFLPWILGIFATILFVVAMFGSSSFQECASNYANTSQYKQNSGSTFFSFVNSVLDLTRLTCVGSFIHHTHEEILASFTVLLALFTLALWASTSKIAKDAKTSTNKTIKIMEDTTERQLRAYLTIEQFSYVSHLDTINNAIWWSIHPVWRNTGATPTSALFLNTNSALSDQKLPDNFDFLDAPGESIKMVIGAHLSITASLIKITGADLVAVRDGTKFFYIWGWAKYKDGFPNTPERITRFCNHITHVTGNPTYHYNRETNPIEITFSFYKENNCIDDGCQEQKFNT